MSTLPQPPHPDVDEGPFRLTVRLDAGPLVDLLAARLILVILDELQRDRAPAHIELIQPSQSAARRSCLR